MKYLILIAFVFIGFNTFAQFKIGSITIDSETFKDYMADCYIHPDTVKDINPYEGLCDGCLIDANVQDERERRAKDFNNNLRKNNVGIVTDTVYFQVGVDTLYTTSGSKITSILKHDAGYYVNYNGYLMPRSPSEQDFIKWYNTKTKLQ